MVGGRSVLSVHCDVHHQLRSVYAPIRRCTMAAYLVALLWHFHDVVRTGIRDPWTDRHFAKARSFMAGVVDHPAWGVCIIFPARRVSRTTLETKE